MKAIEQLNSINSQLRELEYLLAVQQEFRLAKKWSLEVKINENIRGIKVKHIFVDQLITAQIDIIKQELEPYLTEEFYAILRS